MRPRISEILRADRGGTERGLREALWARTVYLPLYAVPNPRMSQAQGIDTVSRMEHVLNTSCRIIFPSALRARGPSAPAVQRHIPAPSANILRGARPRNPGPASILNKNIHPRSQGNVHLTIRARRPSLSLSAAAGRLYIIDSLRSRRRRQESCNGTASPSSKLWRGPNAIQSALRIML